MRGARGGARSRVPSVSLAPKARALVPLVRRSRLAPFLPFLLFLPLAAEVAQREAKEASDRGTVTEGCLPQGGGEADRKSVV